MQDRLELEQVIRAEISARMDSFKQLKQEAADQNEIFRGQLVRAERKIEIVLDAQRQVNSKADGLQVDLNSFETSTAAQFTSVNENVAKETLSLKKRLDREVEHMTDALKSKGDELDNTLQVWPTLLLPITLYSRDLCRAEGRAEARAVV